MTVEVAVRVGVAVRVAVGVRVGPVEVGVGVIDIPARRAASSVARND